MDAKKLAKALRDTAQSASNTIASNVSLPVDALAWALRKAGMPIPENAIGGSDWMAQKGLTLPVQEGIPKMAGEVLAGVGPAVVEAKAPQIASGLIAMGKNALYPTKLNSQAGMIRIPGRGQIPETRSDVNKLADRFSGLLDDAGVTYTHDKSAISPSRYFEFDNPQTLASEYGPDRFKVRISDHRNVHGSDISVDPATGGTFEEMLQSIRNIGVPVANKVKPASKEVIDDATLEKILGIPVDVLKSRGMDIDALRSRYKWDKKGYWTDKK